MKTIITVAFVACGLLSMQGAEAGGINDNATVGGYWGADGHGYGDVIGDSRYDISGATITRTGSVLTITISTNFAGQAGADANIVSGGIGYGDVFLANAWNPKGTAADHYSTDSANATGSTDWQYGLNLDNRMNNSGGSFKLYKLTGSNAASILNSDSFISCPSGCVYRNGQAVAVNTAAAAADAYIVKKGTSEVSGTWKVFENLHQIEFKLDMTGTDLINFNSFAMHWGETCQNDVLEGATSVPLPGSMPLVALGLGAMLLLRRRQAGQSPLA